MKTRSMVRSFLLTLTAVYGVASITIDGENNGRLAGGKNTQFNQGIGIFSSQESNDSSSDVEGDDSSTIVDCDDDCEDLKTAKKDKNLPNHNDSWNGQLSHNPYNSKVPGGQNGKDDQNRSDTYNWLNNQRERSSTEYFGSDEEGSDRPYNGYRIICPGFGGHMVDKMAALDEMVVAELQRPGGGDLLDVAYSMPVKKCVLKVDKRTYVSLGATELRRADSPVVLEHLSVDATADRVRVECAFGGLAGNGTYKTNVKRGGDGSSCSGQYVVDMSHVVRGNVTARFHRGRRAAGSVVAGSFAVNGLPPTVAAATVAHRYRAAMDRSVVSAVHEATHRGLVARLKSELNAPAPSSSSSGHRYRHHFDHVRDHAAASLCDPKHTTRSRPLDSVSYTRLGHAYRMRFDVRLVGPVRWAGRAVDAASGRPVSVGHVADTVRIRVTVVRSVGGDYGCRTVDARVRITGLVSVSGDGLASSSVRPTDVQRSFAARLEDSLRSAVCNRFIPTALSSSSPS